MEEQKIVSKEVKMDVHKADNTPKKLSYEELNKACIELSQQGQNMQSYIQKLHTQIQQMEAVIQMKRLDYLFMVLKYQANFNSDFVIECGNEIQEALTPQSEKPNQEN